MDIKDFIRIGTITAVFPERNTARVVFDDMGGDGGLDSGELPFLVTGSKDDKYYSPMTVDTQVLCLRLPHGKNTGFILGTWFQDVDTPPESNGNVAIVKFRDGTTVRHDTESGALSIQASGSVTVTAPSVTVSADTVSINGGSGDVVVNGISLVNHTHGGIQSGPSSTGKPQ